MTNAIFTLNIQTNRLKQSVQNNLIRVFVCVEVLWPSQPKNSAGQQVMITETLLPQMNLLVQIYIAPGKAPFFNKQDIHQMAMSRLQNEAKHTD